ncbi:MAG: tetratricopeptide repeat protein [Deltaproteobacteria bacterium]|nr:tetratricopeptide repeat protein [Deltaproteobacteria bacterium]
MTTAPARLQRARQPKPWALLGLVLLPGMATAQPRACEKSLWGCAPATAPKSPEDKSKSGKSATASKALALPELAAQYDKLCSKGRTALRFVQSVGTGDLKEAITQLTEATQLWPAQPDAWALLGLALLETGATAEAEAALQTAQALHDSATTDPAAPAPAQRRLEGPLASQVAAGLGLLLGQGGDPAAAVLHYQRALKNLGPSHRLLYRLGDALMASGRLAEATDSYQRGCNLPRGYQGTTLELARACHGLLVAQLRSGHAASVVARTLRTLSSVDPDHRAVTMSDFFPPGERFYYQALTDTQDCERRQHLGLYLLSTKDEPAPPATYVRRAQQQHQQSVAAGCVP